MHVFVISLAHSTKRRASISEQLQRLGVAYEFVDAVNGKAMTEEEVAIKCDMDEVRKHPQWLNRGAIGCALTHIQIYKTMLERKLDHAVILEDDMVIPNDFPSIIRGLEQWSEENLAVLLYYRGFQPMRLSSRVLGRVEQYRRHRPVRPVDVPITTGGYYLTAHAARTLLQVLEPVRVAADSWKAFYDWEGIRNVDVLYPRPLSDANFKSDIDYFEGTRFAWINTLLKAVDRWRVPGIFHFLRWRRQQNERAMHRFEFMDVEPEW